jgi:hypothetical protein
VPSFLPPDFLLFVASDASFPLSVFTALGFSPRGSIVLARAVFALLLEA